MADQVTNYQCPACTGPLHYEGTTGRLECEYCGSTYSVEEIEKMYASASAQAEAASEAAASQAQGGDEWSCDAEQWTENGMKAYSCPSCGAELVCDETTAATSCPYCGNPTIVPGQFTGMLKPEYIIPFKLNKEAAITALKNHYKGKFLLPKSFTDENHIEEIKGVYVPFWLYDGTAAGSATYDATKSRTYRQGDFEVKDTQHFEVNRSGSLAFEKIPADASSKMPDDLIDSIEPYDYSELKKFTKAYLPGYLADKYDVSAEEDAERAVSRAKQTLRDSLRRSVTGYETVSEKSSHIKVSQGKIHYALMPVWLLSTKWNGENYLFAMNGQTGRLVGDLPTDKKKFWLLFAGIAAGLEVLMYLLMFVL